MRNGRCKNHGGMSMGAKTKAGRARIAKATSEGMLRWWARKRAEEALQAEWARQEEVK